MLVSFGSTTLTLAGSRARDVEMSPERLRSSIAIHASTHAATASPVTSMIADTCTSLTRRRLSPLTSRPLSELLHPRPLPYPAGSSDATSWTARRGSGIGEARSSSLGRQHVVHGQVRVLAEGRHRLPDALLRPDRLAREPLGHRLAD